MTTASVSKKSESAFRTISEVAEDLNVQQHVLRFWETKFGQIKPLKRGGGRRYYRPEDVALLKKIHTLLYVEGYTIKGVQKLLKGVSKSQVLEEQKAENQNAQAFGQNLPHVQGPDANVVATDDAILAAPTDLQFDEGEGQRPMSQTSQPQYQPKAAGFSAQQKAALESVLAELVDMREQLRAVTGEAKKSNAA
jgi:DNA-binding transcriptional MerR regulator